MIKFINFINSIGRLERNLEADKIIESLFNKILNENKTIYDCFGDSPYIENIIEELKKYLDAETFAMRLEEVTLVNEMKRGILEFRDYIKIKKGGDFSPPVCLIHIIICV